MCDTNFFLTQSEMENPILEPNVLCDSASFFQVIELYGASSQTINSIKIKNVGYF